MEEMFYHNNRMSITLEGLIGQCADFDEFERTCSAEMLRDDCRIGNYLAELLYKYDRKAAVVSVEAMLAPAYVGNIINGKRNNPSRDALIRICLAIGASVEETQYLLKYGGYAPLYVRRKRDVIIWFGLMKGEGLDIVNENLTGRGLRPLYSE